MFLLEKLIYWIFYGSTDPENNTKNNIKLKRRK